MRYTVTKQVIQIIGTLWQGCEAATVKELSSYDMANLGDPESRDDVERWLMLNVGDFQRITDFHADFTIGDKSIVHEWASEESECVFGDCMYPEDN